MATLGESAAPQPPAQRSSWQSSVFYLFGGLSAMVGLIAFALLILACSYWKLSGNLENREIIRDLEESGEEEGGRDGGAKAAPPVLEEKYLVIMAGQEKPTFLAVPTSSRASSFGSKSGVSCSSSSENTLPISEEDYEEKRVESSGGQIEMVGTLIEAHESALDQVH